MRNTAVASIKGVHNPTEGRLTYPATVGCISFVVIDHSSIHFHITASIYLHHFAMTCQFSPNTTLVPNVPFSIFVASQTDNITCPSTYLRPDPGGALIPWLYSLFLLLFHLPACVLRVVRWQSAQYLSLGLAALSIALCIQSYISTGLVAEEILVWMPLTLMLDVGAMLQMVVLLIEKERGLGRSMAIALRNFTTTILQGLGTFGGKPSGEEAQEDHELMVNGNSVTQTSGMRTLWPTPAQH